jgi:hypothetical protein
MCYSVYLSTDAHDDLSRKNNELIRLEKISTDHPIASLLEFKHKWFVGSKSGCSCTFRHLFSTSLGFSGPVNWYQEEDDEIQATLLFITIVRNILDSGNHADCIDVWYGADNDDITRKTVNLTNVSNEQFRFFENHYFRFQKDHRTG